MIASAVIDLQNRKFEVFSFTKSTLVTSRGVASLYTDNLLKFQDFYEFRDGFEICCFISSV